MLNPFLCPGAIVCQPGRPEWGRGQVQSVIGNRVTVMFDEVGKIVINNDLVRLEPPGEPDA